ncbi:GNAT family N-acetyltransferase [Legionella sp. km772]|uniref:GNAT family N-acetyltransferase n=1 Tax=Legionella sp. km772 TaxID=2498111 RepID=UPI000F8E2859|nr:GNAT family N-acetyltransferase [Legionella sp. km772]RUR12482.1 GNAT family N-acetyltransferase [Legionella sp. km772]
MDKDYQITNMNRDEVDLAIEWAAEEGWNPGLHDASCFYNADPNGFFAGKLNNKIIALGSAVIYDEHFAFCGLYIVDKAYRDKGYGFELTKARLAYVGSRNAGIDGVLEMCDKYQNLGYQFAHNNARFRIDKLVLNPPPSSHIIPASQLDFSQLCAYDKNHFPASRPTFLHYWIQQQDSLTLGFISDNQLKGYGVIRACREGFKIGPLFADNPEIANILFQHLAQYAKGQCIFLDIPENNVGAIELTQRYKMVKVFATARMYLKEQPKLPIEEIYGITSFELG